MKIEIGDKWIEHKKDKSIEYVITDKIGPFEFEVTDTSCEDPNFSSYVMNKKDITERIQNSNVFERATDYELD
jgi:hypothetical protein